MGGDITMSRKEQRQLEIYAMVKEGVLTLVEAAERLAIGYRQVRRNYRKYYTFPHCNRGHLLISSIAKMIQKGEFYA